MKQGWESKKLGDVCEIYQPTTISKKMMILDGEYPVFGANGIIGRYDKYNHDNPELLVTCRGATCGTVNISLPNSWINGNAMVIRPKTDGLRRDFLTYFFKGAVDLSSVITGSAQPQITRTSLNPVLVPIPPLEEQKQIVAKLDLCFEAIDKAKANAVKNLENAKELFQSKLNDIFSQKGEGWVEKKLLDVCSLKSGTTIAKSLEKGSGDIAYIKVADMNIEENLFSITTSSRYLDFKDINKRNIFPIGTVIFPKRGGAIATNKKRITNIPICADLNTMGAMASDQIVPEYLHYYFLGFNLLDIANGTTILQINNYSFDNLKISLPIEYERQKDIVNLLSKLKEQTQSLESKYQQELNSLEELKKSILQEAFEGEL